MLTLDNRALRDAAVAAPYDFIEILVNEKQYGGGGIFNDQATVVGRHAASPSTCSSTSSAITSPASATSTTPRDVAYETGAAEHVEPWEPNITRCTTGDG